MAEEVTQFDYADLVSRLDRASDSTSDEYMHQLTGRARDKLTALRAEIAARDALLRECLRWIPLLDNHEAGSTTDCLCDKIHQTLAGPA